MDDMELTECLINTEIKALEYKIQLEKNRELKDRDKILKYQGEKAGLKRALRFMMQVQDMEE